MWLLDLLGGAFGASLTGLVGSAVTKYFDLKNRQHDFKSQESKQNHEVALRNIDERMIEKEFQFRDRIALTEANAKMDVAESEAFKASYGYENQRLSNSSKLSRAQNAWLALVDGISKIIRPLVTFICVATSLVIYYHASSYVKTQHLSPEQALDVYFKIMDHVLFLTNFCVGWWFGTRIKGSIVK